MAGAPPPNPDNPKPHHQPPPPTAKRKRNLPGTPDPDAEVIALSPATLLSATTFVCDICGKEFRRDQNLQIHRRGHNIPWKHAARPKEEAAKKRVYVCPVEGCVYHDPARALGDLTGIKKHYCRKHGEERRWECERCLKKYAVRTDWRAHVRVCGRREFECCGCGTLFERKESYAIHRETCEATVGEEESDGGYGSGRNAMGGVNFGIRANAVNTELLFPSLWGRVSSATGDKNAEE